MWKKLPVLLRPDEGGEGGSAGGAAPAAAPAATTGQAAAPAAPAAAPAAAAPSAAPAVGEGKPAAAPPAAGAEGAKPAGETKTEAKGIWPDNWRETVSKDDAKVLGRLARYASPEAAIQALIEAQNRISRGELAPKLGKNATPEQIKEWRAANNIPEAADKYDLGKDVEGFEAEPLAAILEQAHKTNQTPEQVKATLAAIKHIQIAANQRRSEADAQAVVDGEDTLRQEWGGEFRRNINLVHGLLDGQAAQPLKEAVLDARMPDGKRIGDSPEVMKMLVSLALIQNPAGVVVPGAHADPAKGVDDEIGAIEKTMRTDRASYNRDEKLQARYRELLGAREKLKPRQAA